MIIIKSNRKYNMVNNIIYIIMLQYSINDICRELDRRKKTNRTNNGSRMRVYNIESTYGIKN